MKKTKILIVEDERVLAEDVKGILHGLGYIVTGIAESANQAMDKVQEDIPDLVLMDIELTNGGKGVHGAREIRSHFDIPVIYVTDHANEDTLRQAEKSEAYGYALKPLGKRELQTTIRMALLRY